MEPHFFIHFCIHFVRNKLTNFFYSTFSNLKFKTLGRVFTILNLKKKGGGVLCLHIHLLKSKSRVADCQFQHDKRFSLTFWKFFFYYYYKFIHLAYHMLQTHNVEFKHKVSSQTDCLCCLCLFQTLFKNHYPFFVILIHSNTKKLYS